MRVHNMYVGYSFYSSRPVGFPGRERHLIIPLVMPVFLWCRRQQHLRGILRRAFSSMDSQAYVCKIDVSRWAHLQEPI